MDPSTPAADHTAVDSDRPRAFLPGEDLPPLSSDPALRATLSHGTGRFAGRRRLLYGGAALGVIALAAGGMLLASSSDHTIPSGADVRAAVDRAATSLGLGRAQVIAPAADLAKVPLPGSASPPIRPAVVIPPKEAQLREVVGFRDRAGPNSPFIGAKPGAAGKAAPAEPIVSEVGMSAKILGSPVPSSTDVAGSAAKSAERNSTLGETDNAAVPAGRQAPEASDPAKATAPPVPERAAPPAPGDISLKPASEPVSRGVEPSPPRPGHDQAPAIAAKPDAVAVAASPRPGPMNAAEQVQVLDLVTQLGALIRDQRSEITALRADQERVAGLVNDKLSDYDRRLALAEAKGAMSAAMGGTAGTAPTPTASPPPRNPAPEAAPPEPTAPKRFRVQAASPNLAMLAPIDRSGDEGAALQIAIGDEVPGYGKVIRIAQRGTAWVVETEHGKIQ
jgi:hypothetical protein